ncbi:Maf1 regulator-domain-containing protein [Kockovaella imperatae]|uniref:Maf1 regulator-domain-containing protein n=1 Tax=Kockovaella imperatae TaxID=4999 RepID=A0A1Y1U651_9TREE|nr:Maf1 regulator-domain-containing protein [Kockovaella imperatae]ORX33498.1 Maf1 regulator-domain-containing protein [Kockovaella imperatae]
MKYLDNPLLLHLSNSLSNIRTPETRIYVRFEAYSVKPMRQERRMYKEMEEAYMSGQEEMEEMSFSPEMREAGLSSCFGRLDEKESRKVHFLLVSTLNSAFPDNDFHSLQPSQFTRERSAAEVLSTVTTSLLGPGAGAAPMIFSSLGVSPPQTGTSAPAAGPSSLPNQSGSPSNLSSGPSTNLPNPHIYRVLNDVVPLEECEVYSWFPEPEYDPHLDAEDGEITEDGMDSDSESSDGSPLLDGIPSTLDIDMEAETPASWGAGGMDLDDVPESPIVPQTVQEGLADADRELRRKKRRGGLLWSQNYFFYAKRTKRILFLTCWCRRRPSQVQAPPIEDGTSFPLPISSSFGSTPALTPQVGTQTRSSRSHRVHNRSNARPTRRSKLTIRDPRAEREASTIPIRGMETPRPRVQPATPRLASSAPSLISALSPQAALAKMSVGGFRPKQTPARAAMNATGTRVTGGGGGGGGGGGMTPRTATATTLPPSTGVENENRIRREGSKSSTPGGGTLMGMGTNVVDSVPGTKGKRVKV